MFQPGITTPLLSATERLGREPWASIANVLSAERFPDGSPKTIARAIGEANHLIMVGLVETELFRGDFLPVIYNANDGPYVESKVPTLTQSGLEIAMDALHTFTSRGGFTVGPESARLDQEGQDTLHRFINGAVVRAIKEAQELKVQPAEVIALHVA